MRGNRFGRMFCAALCAALLCTCGREAAPVVLPPEPAAETRAFSRLEEGGASLPSGRLSLVSLGGAARPETEVLVLSGDALRYRRQKGESVYLLPDAATGAASYYAIRRDGAAAQASGSVICAADGSVVYTCAADEKPLCAAAGRLLIGKCAPDGAVCPESAFLDPSTGKMQPGPQDLAAGAHWEQGAVPGGGFWLRSVGADGTGSDVLFFDAEARQTARAENSRVCGFIGGAACLAAQMPGAGNALLQTDAALTMFDPDAGKTLQALPAGAYYPAGYGGYMVRSSASGSAVYDAAGAQVASFAGWCCFYNGHMAVLSEDADLSGLLPARQEAPYLTGRLTLVAPDGRAEAITAAAWNTRSGALAVTQAGQTTVYGPGGKVQYAAQLGGDAVGCRLLADGTLAVQQKAGGVALYTHAGSVYASRSYTNVTAVAGSAVPILSDAAGGFAIVLENGRTVVAQLDACQPLSDTRTAVRQAGTVGLLDAAGRWIWSLDTAA